MEAKYKHLEFIQGIINRLASDSFRMKGWSVVLVSALLVLMAREDGSGPACIGFVPVLVFWGLDGYFLWQERLFRDLYDHVRTMDASHVDFSMNVGAFQAHLVRRNVFQNAGSLPPRVGPCDWACCDDQAEFIRHLDMTRGYFTAFTMSRTVGGPLWSATSALLKGIAPPPDNDWETVKMGGDAAIERWIASQMHYRSCTVVLVGSNTANRKWINYELLNLERWGWAL